MPFHLAFTLLGKRLNPGAAVQRARPAVIAQIMRLLRAQTADAGDVIVRRGDTAQRMYFIANGEVGVELEGRRVTLGVGHFFGEIARRSATARATTRTNLWYSTRRISISGAGAAQSQGLQFDLLHTSFFVGQVKIILKKPSRWRSFRFKVFEVMHRNAVSITDFVRIPPNRVVEFGVQIEI
jgi:hypothetical protein